MPAPILLYDGVCGLCNRLVQFMLRRDRQAIFRFASLQSALAARILARHGANPVDLDTVYVVLDHDPAKDNPNHDATQDDSTQARQPDERLLSRSDAVLFILHQLGGFCRFLAFLLQLLPNSFRDWAYNAIARHRYRIFGRSETCILPTAKNRSRFLDL
jgi:predicted DCC family thiol-disulfide oxidoreductase YuxK